MRFISRLSIIILLAVGSLQAQTKVNPVTGINWPAIAGSGTPAATGAVCNNTHYGQAYQDLSVTPNLVYTCGSDGWGIRGGTGGTGCVGGNLIANGCTAATTAASALANLQGISSVLTTPQTMAGPLNVPKINGAFNVDGITYTTIAAAVAAAGSTRAIITIPSTYGGVECPAVTSNIVFLDYRGIPGGCPNNAIEYNAYQTGAGAMILEQNTVNSIVSGSSAVSHWFQTILSNAALSGSAALDGISSEAVTSGTLSGTLTGMTGNEAVSAVRSTGGTITSAQGIGGYVFSPVGSTTAITNAYGVYGLGCAYTVLGARPANCYGLYGAEQYGTATGKNYAGAFEGSILLRFSPYQGRAALDMEDSTGTPYPVFIIGSTNLLQLSAPGTAGVGFYDSTGVLQMKLSSTGVSTGAGAAAAASGNYWTANGYQAGGSNTTGNGWTAYGESAGINNTTGSTWTATGSSTGRSSTTGGAWTATGYAAGLNDTTGSFWTANGAYAGAYIADGSTPNTTGANSLYDGASTYPLTDGDINENVIGYGTIGHGSNTTTIGNTSVTDTYLGGANLWLAGVKVLTGGGGSTTLTQTSLDDSLTTWKPVCVVGGCAGGTPGGTDTPTATVQTIGNASPSLDGASMLLSLTTPVTSTQTNALWARNGASCDTCTSLTSDFEVYIGSNGAHASSFEFDSYEFDKTDLLNFMFGTQCNQTAGFWQIANQSSGWTSTTLACSLSYSTWHHIIENFTRDAASSTACSGMPCEHFVSISIDGTVTTLGLTEPSTVLPGTYASVIANQFQIDIGATTSAQTVTMNLDEVNFSASPTTAGQFLPLMGGTLTGALYGPSFNDLNLTGYGSTSNINLGGALNPSATGTNNIAVGAGSMNALTTGYNNHTFGDGTLYYCTTCYSNNAFGLNALQFLTTGYENNALGTGALNATTTGHDNDAQGHNALGQNVDGSSNVGVGAYAGWNSGTPLQHTNTSTFIGEGVNNSVDSLANTTVIGYNAQGTASNQVTIGNAEVTSTILQGAVAAGTSVKTGVYTVSALPTGLPAGSIVAVSDASSLTAGTCVGLGSTYTVAIYNGTTWTCM